MAWPGHCIAYFTKTAPDALEFGYDVSPGVLIARSRSGGGERGAGATRSATG